MYPELYADDQPGGGQFRYRLTSLYPLVPVTSPFFKRTCIAQFSSRWALVS